MADQLYNEISKEEWKYLYNAFKDKEEVSWKFALGASKEEGREEQRVESVKVLASTLLELDFSLEDCLKKVNEKYSDMDTLFIQQIIKDVFKK